jgi:hypothetical protein
VVRLLDALGPGRGGGGDPQQRLSERAWLGDVDCEITRTKTLGTERLARKLHDALPDGDQPLRAAVWTFLRPNLSPASPR